MRIRPVGKRIVLKKIEEPKRESGLVIVGTVQPEVDEAEIVEVAQDMTAQLRGLHAVYAAREHVSREVKREDGTYLILDREDVMAIAEPGEKRLSERILTAAGTWIWIDWEKARETVGSGALLKAPQYARNHYTGIVRSLGERVTVPAEEGKRYFFEQFADWKYWYEGEKRYALVPQHSLQCEVPMREEVQSEGDMTDAELVEFRG